MDTKLATKQFRINQWMAIIQDRIDSGMKVDDYCNEHHLSKNAYYYWLKKIREQAIESAGVQFADISPMTSGNVSSGAVFVAAVSVDVNGMTVNVNESTPVHLLKRVLEVVKDVT